MIQNAPVVLIPSLQEKTRINKYKMTDRTIPPHITTVSPNTYGKKAKNSNYIKMLLL